MEAGERRVAVEPIAPGSTTLDADLLPVRTVPRPRSVRPVVWMVLGAIAVVLVAAGLMHGLVQRPPAAGPAMANARDAETALETFAVGNGGSYDGATLAELRRIDPGLGTVELRVSGATYVITTTAGERSYSIARGMNGGVVLSCSPAGSGGCSANGIWH